MNEKELTDDEIFLLKQVAEWWKRAKVLQFEELLYKEKDEELKTKWAKTIAMLKDMKVNNKYG